MEQEIAEEERRAANKKSEDEKRKNMGMWQNELYRIAMRGAYSEQTSVTVSVLAGCGHATALLGCLLRRSLRR